MTAPMSARRAELIDRCRRERNAFLATTARNLAALPRAHDAVRLFRTLRRIARVALRAGDRS
jgi:hypothetical protein